MSIPGRIGQAICFIFAAYIAACVVVLTLGTAASVVYLAGHYLFSAF